MSRNCVCGKAVGPGRATCGSSYCQEADYLRCTAKNARKGPRREEAERRARIAEAVALEMSTRRMP